MTAKGIEPQTFWLVAHCLNQLRHQVLLPWGILEIHNCFGLKVKQPFRVLDFGPSMDSLRSTMHTVRFAAFTDPDKDLLTCSRSTAKGTVNTAIILRLSGCRSEWSCWKIAEPWSQQGKAKGVGYPGVLMKTRGSSKLDVCLSEAVNIKF